MAAQPAAIRGRASGWYQAGNVGLGSLGGGAFIWLPDRMGLAALSCTVAAAIFLPALAACRVTEIPHTAFTSLLLDVLGHGRRAAATGYSVLLSFGNFPVASMTWVDGVGYRHGGARGLMGVDALANGVCRCSRLTLSTAFNASPKRRREERRSGPLGASLAVRRLPIGAGGSEICPTRHLRRGFPESARPLKILMTARVVN